MTAKGCQNIDKIWKGPNPYIIGQKEALVLNKVFDLSSRSMKTKKKKKEKLV